MMPIFLRMDYVSCCCCCYVSYLVVIQTPLRIFRIFVIFIRSPYTITSQSISCTNQTVNCIDIRHRISFYSHFPFAFPIPFWPKIKRGSRRQMSPPASRFRLLLLLLLLRSAFPLPTNRFRFSSISVAHTLDFCLCVCVCMQ